MVSFTCFLWRLSSENRETLDHVSGGVFMKYTIDQAWELLNDMRMNKEAWSEDLSNKGGTKVEYDCIQDFIDAGKLDKLSETLHMDSDIILQHIKRYCHHEETYEAKLRAGLFGRRRSASQDLSC